MARKLKREKLTENQDKFVRANHNRMCISEMADAQKIPYSRIYSHMIANDIAIKEFRTKKIRVNTSARPGFFNPGKKENWLF